MKVKNHKELSEFFTSNFTGIVDAADGAQLINWDSIDYYQNGKIHREDGPAREYANGKRYWFLNGKCFSDESMWKDSLNENKTIVY
jgi:hypothetical protein